MCLLTGRYDDLTDSATQALKYLRSVGMAQTDEEEHVEEIESVFATLVQQRAGALMISADALFFSQRDQLVALAGSASV